MLKEEDATPRDFTHMQIEIVKKYIDDITTETFKTAFILRHFNGMSYLEIAETMKLNLSTVKTAIRQSRIQIRKLIKEDVEKQIEDLTQWDI